MQDFTFNYFVPEADTLAQQTHYIEVKAKGYYNEDRQPQVLIIDLTFPFLTAFELVSQNATMVKLLDATKKHYEGLTNNARPIANSEEVVNNILGINNPN